VTLADHSGRQGFGRSVLLYTLRRVRPFLKMPTGILTPRTLYDKIWDDHVVFVACLLVSGVYVLIAWLEMSKKTVWR
jgi:hypothetical protein